MDKNLYRQRCADILYTLGVEANTAKSTAKRLPVWLLKQLTGDLAPTIETLKYTSGPIDSAH